MVTWLVVALGIVLVGALRGWFEAGWLRKRVLEVELDGVPRELDGVRIAHLSDFHLGVPSRGRRAVAQAVEWVAARRPELVVVTGDLLSRRGEPLSSNGFSESLPCFVVLGNHDYADSRDPFSQHVDPAVFAALEGVTLLGDEEIDVELRGQRVQIVGVAPRTYAARRAEPHLLADRDSALRLLLCHFRASRGAYRRGRFTRSSPGTTTPVRSSCRTRAGRSTSPTRGLETSAASTATARAFSTSLPASGRHSSPSGSSPGRRSRSWLYDR